MRPSSPVSQPDSPSSPVLPSDRPMQISHLFDNALVSGVFITLVGPVLGGVIGWFIAGYSYGIPLGALVGVLGGASGGVVAVLSSEKQSFGQGITIRLFFSLLIGGVVAYNGGAFAAWLVTARLHMHSAVGVTDTQNIVGFLVWFVVMVVVYSGIFWLFGF